MKWEGEGKLDNYQDLLCYICGASPFHASGRAKHKFQKATGPMTICKNALDPSRNDKFGRDGYSACCPKSKCQSKIGTERYYKEIVSFEKEKYELFLNWKENPFSQRK